MPPDIRLEAFQVRKGLPAFTAVFHRQHRHAPVRLQGQTAEVLRRLREAHGSIFADGVLGGKGRALPRIHAALHLTALPAGIVIQNLRPVGCPPGPLENPVEEQQVLAVKDGLLKGAPRQQLRTVELSPGHVVEGKAPGQTADGLLPGIDGGRAAFQINAVRPAGTDLRSHLRQALIQLFQQVRLHPVVGIHKGEIRSPRPADSLIPCGGGPPVFREVEGPHPAVPGFICVAAAAASVGGGVVHQDNFNLRIRLGQQGIQAGLQTASHVVHRHDHADQRSFLFHSKHLPIP